MPSVHRGSRVLAAVVAVAWPTTASAQEAGFQTPLNSDPVIPIPTGQSGQPGFYTGMEFVMLFQTKAIGNQLIASRGIVDTTGNISGFPGTFIGTGQPALSTNQMGSGGTGMPGFRLEIGYKFDTGTRIYVNYMQTYDAHYSAGASGIGLNGFSARPDLADTFLYSPVYNFSQAFNGAQLKTSFDTTGNGGFNTVGIWNGATQMDTKFTQRFQQAEPRSVRTPMFATGLQQHSTVGWWSILLDLRKVLLANRGHRQHRQRWPQNTAVYTNNLSQRMYGAFVGCGHEVYLGNMFSASLDLTAAGFMDVIKGRAKYKLGDDSTESKFGS